VAYFIPGRPLPPFRNGKAFALPGHKIGKTFLLFARIVSWLAGISAGVGRSWRPLRPLRLKSFKSLNRKDRKGLAKKIGLA
jgi:hypothetical protein